MSGIKRSANRPKTPKHLRTVQSKSFTNRTREEREQYRRATDAWAERIRTEGDNDKGR
jgi:hypothetical protein